MRLWQFGVIVAVIGIIGGVLIATSSDGDPPSETRSTFVDPDLRTWFRLNGEKAATIIGDLQQIMLEVNNAGQNGNLGRLKPECTRMAEEAAAMNRIRDGAPPHWLDFQNELELAARFCLKEKFDIAASHLEKASDHLTELTKALAEANEALAESS